MNTSKMSKSQLIEYGTERCMFEHLSSDELAALTKPQIVAEIKGAELRSEVAAEITAAATDTVVELAPKRAAKAAKAKPAAKKAPAKSAPKSAPAKKRDTSIKTWTLAAVQVRAAVADIKSRMGLAAREGKVELGLRTHPHYATTEAEARQTPADDDLREFLSVEKATATPEVRGHGYVAHVYVTTRGELDSVWTVWLPAEGFVVLTRDGAPVK